MSRDSLSTLYGLSGSFHFLWGAADNGKAATGDEAKSVGGL